MRFNKEKTEVIKQFIIDNLPEHPNDIAAYASEKLNITRQTTYKYLKEFIADGFIRGSGKTKGIQYEFVPVNHNLEFPMNQVKSESDIWAGIVIPILPELTTNVREICAYGFQEMLNNVIDHASATKVIIGHQYTLGTIKFFVIDNGVGVFNKIQKDLNLATPQQAILELAKGKFTSDPTRHSGEGIYFTSRMFDHYAILSGKLGFLGHDKNDWIFDRPESDNVEGTTVSMEISRNSKRTIGSVFNQFTIETEDYGFNKTKIPLKLMQYEGESLVSRSQAKRLMARADKFLEVILDFEGIKFIGQAFADEIFRVFRNQHPEVKIIHLNATKEIEAMIKHVTTVVKND